MNGIPPLPLVSTLLLVHGSVILATRCRSSEECDQVQCHRNLDVAIVGAGPGGTYSAFELRKTGRSIGVFEYSDRVGGRLFTHKLEGSEHQVELGGMRFKGGVHTRLEKIIDQLDLTTKMFSESCGRKGRIRFFLRNHSMSQEELLYGDVPYNLTHEEKANQANLVDFYMKKLTGLQLDGQQLTRKDIMTLRVKDGRLLYHLTFDEAIDLVTSPDAKEFIKDSQYLNAPVADDVSAVNIFALHHTEVKGSGTYTIAEGMSSIPKKMLETFLVESQSHSVTMNRELRAIRRRSDGEYVLYFQNTVTSQRLTTRLYDLSPEVKVCARQVILAIPHLALSLLDWPALKEERVLNAMHAVIHAPTSKVFMTFDRAWWLTGDRAAYVTVTDQHFCQAMDWWTSPNSTSYTLMVSYCDMHDSRHIGSLWAQGPPIEGSEQGYGRVTQPLKETLLKGLADAYGISRDDIPEPMTAISQIWHDHPFAAGCVVWRAGHHFQETIDTLRRPSLTDEVFVVGSDFSWGNLAHWTEGALETADTVIQKYFLGYRRLDLYGQNATMNVDKCDRRQEEICVNE